jgi:hypothetical protein
MARFVSRGRLVIPRLGQRPELKVGPRPYLAYYGRSTGRKAPRAGVNFRIGRSECLEYRRALDHSLLDFTKWRTCARWQRICSRFGISRLRLREGKASKSRLRDEASTAIQARSARVSCVSLRKRTPMSARTLSKMPDTRPTSCDGFPI